MVSLAWNCHSIHDYSNLHTEPAEPPQNVTAIAMSSTDIVIMWEEVPTIDQNGVITTYEIQFVPLMTFGGQIASDTVNTSNGSVLTEILTGLEEYVEYNISVRAYTSAGPGPYSDGIVERTDTDGSCFMYFIYTCRYIHLLSIYSSI